MFNETWRENGKESFEELQQLFEDMFQADIGLDGGPSLASFDSSTSSAYMTYSESSSSNKSNSSEMNFGKAENSSVFDTSYQNFCFGLYTLIDGKNKLKVDKCLTTPGMAPNLGKVKYVFTSMPTSPPM
ncbi:hypothetical protein GmHk_01G001295 [Glycine max]|nr:hypothetical protein GmHk_01G001295 [Glycine max]